MPCVALLSVILCLWRCLASPPPPTPPPATDENVCDAYFPILAPTTNCGYDSEVDNLFIQVLQAVIMAGLTLLSTILLPFLPITWAFRFRLTCVVGFFPLYSLVVGALACALYSDDLNSGPGSPSTAKAGQGNNMFLAGFLIAGLGGLPLQALLWFLALKNRGRSAASAPSQLKAAAKSLAQNSNTPAAVVAACRSIDDLCTGVGNVKARNRVAARNLGVLASMPVALHQLQAYPDVAEVACKATRGLTISNTDNMAALETAGGIPVLVAVLRHHADKPMVAAAACGALVPATANVLRRKQAAAAAGLVPVLLDVIHRHGDAAAVLKSACAVGRNMSSVADIRQTMLDGGAIQLALDVWRRHADDGNVVANAAPLAQNLIIGNAAAGAALATGGVMPLIFTALDQYSGSFGTLSAVCSLMRNLGSVTPAARVGLVTRGALPRLLTLLERYAAKPKFNEHVAAVFRNITIDNPDTSRAVVSAGSVGALMQAMGRHAGHSGVVSQVVHCFSNIAKVPDLRSGLADAGAPRAVRVAAARHASSAAIQAAATAFKNDMEAPTEVVVSDAPKAPPGTAVMCPCCGAGTTAGAVCAQCGQQVDVKQ